MTQDNNTSATSYIPMLYDKTVYAIYLIIKGSKYNHAELKAFSKICNINYLEANQKLKHKKNFMGKGNAYWIKDTLQKLSLYHVAYEIVPPYPYLQEEQNKTYQILHKLKISDKICVCVEGNRKFLM